MIDLGEGREPCDHSIGLGHDKGVSSSVGRNGPLGGPVAGSDILAQSVGNPAFRQMLTSRFIPGGTKEQMDWFNELQRISVSAENAVRIRESNNNIDITPLLSQIDIPTLVLHCRGDAIISFEEGRRLAAMIPRARFVPLEGNNHLILENEPAWPRFLYEVRGFLSN